MKQISVRPNKNHLDKLLAFYAQHGALIRFSGHRTTFVDEPEEFVREGWTYFMLTQLQFASMFCLVKHDTTDIITKKMTKVHNDFYRDLSDADGEIFREAKSQKQLSDLSGGNIKMVPYIGMVRIYDVCV